MPKRWRRKARGGLSEGWISKTASNEPRDGISAPESGSRAHMSRRVELRPPEKSGELRWPRRVDDCFPAGFPPTCRSASCASESKVADRRRDGRKKSPAARRSDDGGRGFRKENKMIERKHGHRKRN